jgi:hypothetical protein
MPPAVWLACCGSAERAVKVGEAYDEKAIWFFPCCSAFVVAASDGSILSLAHAFADRMIAEGYAQGVALMQSPAQTNHTHQ